MLIDTHAHFDMVMQETGLGEEDLLAGMESHNLSKAVQISISTGGLAWSRDFARRHSGRGILFSAGIHPSDRAGGSELTVLENFVAAVMEGEDKNLLFGIGECGLDYFRMRQEKEMQRASFLRQLALAKKWGIPVIVHSREAMEESLAMLRESGHGRGIMHCFPGDSGAARKALDLGLHISFAGNVTYRSAREIHESAEYVPLDRILLETDAPFLTPVPLRGKKNMPHHIAHTYRFIADLKKIPVEKLQEAVEENFAGLMKPGIPSR